MKLWLDAHLSPKLVHWLRSQPGLEAAALRDLGLRHAKDPQIFVRDHVGKEAPLSVTEHQVPLAIPRP